MATCDHDGKKYDELDVFDIGDDGCVKCICVDNQICCNQTKCKNVPVNPNTKIDTTVVNDKYLAKDIKIDKNFGEIKPSQNDYEHPENVYIQRYKNGYRRRLRK